MDDAHARRLLTAERERVEALLASTATDARSDRSEANDAGPYDNAADRLTAKEVDDAVAASLRARLEAIERAEGRLRDGTYGRSVRSGDPITDERLEADPAAELTADEARSAEGA